jgi:AcrR family transcriptional regulator
VAGAGRRTRSKTAGSRDRGTRDHILDVALSLFRKHGFDATTMRDVAAAAEMALGAAYYYFPSKESLALAYYERISREQAAAARATFATTQDLRGRLAAVVHGRLEWLRRDRKLVAPLFRRIADPEDPVSVFSAETAAVREETIALFAEALDGTGLEMDASTRRLAAVASWSAMLGVLLYFAHDRSPGQRRTHALADELVSLIADLLPLFASPLGEPLRTRLSSTLERAGLLGG